MIFYAYWLVAHELVQSKGDRIRLGAQQDALGSLLGYAICAISGMNYLIRFPTAVVP